MKNAGKKKIIKVLIIDASPQIREMLKILSVYYIKEELAKAGCVIYLDRAESITTAQEKLSRGFIPDIFISSQSLTDEEIDDMYEWLEKKLPNRSLPFIRLTIKQIPVPLQPLATAQSKTENGFSVFFLFSYLVPHTSLWY